MLSIFKPAPHKARLPAAEIDPTYRRLRWQIFLGIFFGYAAYYLVRKNFALAMPYLVEQGFSRGDLGFALSGISIAYGFSKFIMGSVSDRSNPRVFLPAGLILAAAVMLFMGFVPWATSSIAVMFVLLFLCGWFQGMGWPPCGRTMVHWWSQKERGGIVSVWNCAHNVGGGIPPLLFLLGMAWFNDWHAALYMPAFCAILAASAIVGYTVDFFGWDGGFMVMIGGSILAVILLIVVMIGEKRRHEQLLQKRNGG
ncbi:MFS transporter [Escherichia coli]